MPTTQVYIIEWDIPILVKEYLEDPQFYEVIDMLLGAEIFFDIINNKQLNLGKYMPQLISTKFGWILSGRIGCSDALNQGSCIYSCPLYL